MLLYATQLLLNNIFNDKYRNSDMPREHGYDAANVVSIPLAGVLLRKDELVFVMASTYIILLLSRCSRCRCWWQYYGRRSG